MICPNCKNHVVEGSAYCNKCGIALPPETEAAASQPESVAAAVMASLLRSTSSSTNDPAQPQAEATAAAPKPQPEVDLPKLQPEANLPKPQPEANLPKPQPEANLPKPQPEANLPKPKAASAKPGKAPAADIFTARESGPAAPAAESETTAAPRPDFFAPEPLFSPVSTGNWILTFLLLLFVPLAAAGLFYFITGYCLKNQSLADFSALVIPAVFVLMLLFYAFFRRINPSKRNFFRAVLIISLILLLVGGILFAVFRSYLLTYLNDIINVEHLSNLLHVS
ncbi:MAG: hypothetical protein K6B40_04310 [Firmicutes bacterium]|nr:hypothetical protein [Bacillota bacterium]